MVRGFEELARLGDLLEAEMNGKSFDGEEAHQLAACIAELYPTISGTLARMVERQSNRH